MTDKPSADRRQREFSQSDLDGIDPYFFWVLRGWQSLTSSFQDGSRRDRNFSLFSSV